MSIDSAAKRYAALRFSRPHSAYPAGSIDATARAVITGLYLSATAAANDTTATPILHLGTRAPDVAAGLPTEAVYVEAATLASNALFDHTTTGGDLEFTGSFRVEMDVCLPSGGTSWTLFECTDSTSSRTTTKLDITGATDRKVSFVVDDGTTTDTSDFYALDAGRLAATGVRIRVGAEFDATGQSVQIDYELPSDSSGTLSSASWTTVASTSTTITALETPASTRLWEIDSGTSRLRLIEARILDDGTEVATITGSSVSAPPGSTHSESSITWTVDGNAARYADGDWDDITSFARIPEGGITYRRGRTGDQVQHVASELGAVLNNQGREFEPDYTSGTYYPAIKPLVPLRLCADYNDTIYPLWRGVTRKFTPVYNDQSDTDSVTELQGVDAFRLLSLAKTGTDMASALSGLSMSATWPMTDTGATLDDTVGTNHLTPTNLAQGSDSPFFGDRNKVAYFDSTGYAEDTAADSTLEITGDCSIVFTINTDTGGDYHICSGYGTSGAYWGVELDIADTQQPVVRWIRNDGVSTAAGNDTTLSLDNGYFLDAKPHVVCCTYDQSADTLVVYVDGRKVATNADAVPAGNGSPSVAGTATVRVGSEGTHGSGTSNYVGLMGYLSIVNKVLTDGEAYALTRNRVDGFAANTPAARIGKLLDAYGWPTSARNIDTNTTIVPSDPEAIYDGVTSGWASDTDIVVTIPSEAQVTGYGGYVWVAIAWPSNRTMDTVPAGWTSIASAESGSTFEDVEVEVWRHKVADGDPTSVTFVRSNAAGQHAWVCWAASEVDTGTPETATATNTGSSATSIDASAVTAADGDLLITVHTTFSITSTLTSWSTGPNGMTLIAEQNPPVPGSTQRANIGVYKESDVGAGSTGTRTATRSAAEDFATVTVAVNAATPAGSNGSLAAKNMADASILDELQDVATAEGGEFFIDGDGIAVFRGQGWRGTNAGTAQITFGNVDSETDYRAVSYRYDEDRIINEAIITDADGTAATVVDQTSIDTYGRRSFSRTVDLTGSTASEGQAQNLVDTYADPRLLLDRLDVYPIMDASTLFPALFNLELGERIRVKHRPPSWTSGDMLDKQSHVEQISARVERGTSDWTFTYTGSPAS